MAWLLAEIQNVKAYVTGLALSPKGKHSLLAGLRINSQSSDHLALAAVIHGSRFLEGDEFNIVDTLITVACDIYFTLNVFLKSLLILSARTWII